MNDNTNNGNHTPPSSLLTSSSSFSLVERARYPLPLDLCQWLSSLSTRSTTTTTECIRKALWELLSNAIQALDEWYWTQHQENKKSKQRPPPELYDHRRIIRVAWNHHHHPQQQQQQQQQQGEDRNILSSLTVTDLGRGMTRADLINQLFLWEKEEDRGFWKALAAVGAVGVVVGTKSHYDDYYELTWGDYGNSNNDNNNNNRKKDFVITRPLDKEKMIPTRETTHQSILTRVYGTSGTSVTLFFRHAQQSRSEMSQLLESLLQQMTTQYSFILQDQTLTPEQEQALMQASEDEAKAEMSTKNNHHDEEERPAPQDNEPAWRRTLSSDSIDWDTKSTTSSTTSLTQTLQERAKFIPLRLSYEERQLLRLVDAAMNCCDYTTRVDQIHDSNNHHKAMTKRMHQQVKGILAILKGLLIATNSSSSNMKNEKSTTSKRNQKNNQTDPVTFLGNVLELARRYKRIHPEHMRTSYGTLIHVLQDVLKLQQEGHWTLSSLQSLLSLKSDNDEEDDDSEDRDDNDENDNNEKGTNGTTHLQDAIGDKSNALILPIRTVYRFLEERQGLALLEDPLMEWATQEILEYEQGDLHKKKHGKRRHHSTRLHKKKSRQQIDMEAQRKEQAIQTLQKRYASKVLNAEEIQHVLHSICDNHSFVNSHCIPIDKMISDLQEYFYVPGKRNNNLAIVAGENGARLSHSHERQFYFAYQSLLLWREIMYDMFRLWAMAEDDLLSVDIPYQLQDTGQGLQRVQPSPQTYQAMQEILSRVKQQQQMDSTASSPSPFSTLQQQPWEQECDYGDYGGAHQQEDESQQHWVGSSVIHLGDHNVPNALSFIDKYTQVPRILGPIVKCLEQLEKLCDEDYGIQDMMEDGFGGQAKVKQEILQDFFTSAFDGSGADNFYDAGSCIDGRLTSAWNWCSQLPHKSYYPIFKLTGFTGFDGEFR